MKKAKSRKKKNKVIKTNKSKANYYLCLIGTIITGLTLIFPIRSCILEKHPAYNYEAYFDWMYMDEAASILTDSSEVSIFYDPIESQWDDFRFYKGATLIALYSNLDEQDQVITEFTVRANNIVEDLSPSLNYSFDSFLEPITAHIKNVGWGETGTMRIEFIGITPLPDQGDENANVTVKVKDETTTSWTLKSLKPGEKRDLFLFSSEDLSIQREGSFTAACFQFEFMIYAEGSYETPMSFILDVFEEGEVIHTGGYGDDFTNYVVWIDTSSPKWSKTYRTYQIIPGKQTVRLPICIVPSKSCTMTVEVEFKTANGTIIQATPLSSAYFIVPYYDEPTSYIDGELLDENYASENTIVYFPFVNVDKVVPESEAAP